jgi:hypothetical protein
MSKVSGKLTGVAALTAVLVFSLFFYRAASAAPLQTIPVSKIRRGMTGYGLTVFKGDKPERFRVRVLGILHNTFPKQDLILILCDDPKLKKTGVAAGMSGSPIYFNGKLAGALAYGPVWAQAPVAMVTPIKNMLEVLKQPVRGPKKTVVASRYRWSRRDAGKLSRLGLGFPKLHRLPRPGKVFASTGPGAIRRLALPVSVSGLDRSSLSELEKEMKPYGMFAVPGGGGGSNVTGDRAVRRYGKVSRYRPGSAIGVQYIRGDVTATATGTVTAVVGDEVLAFGHPFWGFGEHYVPVVGSWIHMIMPVQSSSYKISTPLNELGTLFQDRRAAIAANTKSKAPMIPLVVRIRSRKQPVEVFKTEVFDNRIVTPRYLYVLVRAMLKNAVPNVGDVAIRAKVKLGLEGIRDLAFTDYFTSVVGAAYGFNPMMTRGFKVLNFLFRNPFKRIGLRRMEVDVDLRYALQKAAIYSMKVERTVVEPGATIDVTVRLKKWLAGFYERTVPVRIPRVPDGTLIRIKAEPGSQAEPDAAPPESLSDVIRYVKRTRSARQLVLTVRTGGEGTSANGRLVVDLPGSVVDTMRTATNSVKRARLTRAWRKSTWEPYVLNGAESIVLKVRADSELAGSR